MPFDHDSVVQKKYSVEPLPADFIPSAGAAEAQVLWVGCSDSWITETEVLNLAAEETFVHRNLGNIVSNGDLSSMSAIEYAVDILKVGPTLLLSLFSCPCFSFFFKGSQGRMIMVCVGETYRHLWAL